MSYWQQYAPPPAGPTPPNSNPWPANFLPPPPAFNYVEGLQQQRLPPPLWSQPPPQQQMPPTASNWPPLPPWENFSQQGLPIHHPPKLPLQGDSNSQDAKRSALFNTLPPWMRDKVVKYEEEQKARNKNGESCDVPAERPVDVLRDALVAIDVLKQLKTLAQLHIESDEAKWTAIMKEVKSCQNKVHALCEQLSKENVLGDLEAYAQKRHKKRERLKRQAIVRKQEKEEAEKHAAQQEARINAYRQRVVEKALQEKQEAEMKEEADSILSEIRFKISRTREFLERLPALERLREARKDSYRRKGLYVAPEVDETFTREMASVKSLLEHQLSNYLKEETALKVMLESEHKEQHETKKLQVKQSAVLNCLFGSQEVDPISYPFYQYYCCPLSSIEAFTANRKAWDQCLVLPDYSQGSSVPVQWVKPVEPSSQLWAEYCVSDT